MAYKLFRKILYGFRTDLNTETVLKHFIRDVSKDINLNQKVTVIFLDRRGFYTVNHEILLNKLFVLFEVLSMHGSTAIKQNRHK